MLEQSKIKLNITVNSLYYSEACNELTGPISALLRQRNTAPFKEMLQRWRAVGNTASDFNDPKFKPQTSCSRDERVTARPIQKTVKLLKSRIYIIYKVACAWKKLTLPCILVSF